MTQSEILRPQTEFARGAEQSIFSSVRALLCEKFEIVTSNVHLESTLVGDLGIEQADMDYLALTLEAAFDIEITVENAARIVRVRDAVRCIYSLRGLPHD